MRELRDVNDLLRKLKEVPIDSMDRGKTLDRAMRKGARFWVDSAKANLSGRGPGVKNSRTGNVRLVNSIALRKDPDPQSNNADVRFEVGYKASAYWGSFLEEGTEKQPARPFLRPAFDENRDKILRAVADQLQKDIAKAVKT